MMIFAEDSDRMKIILIHLLLKHSMISMVSAFNKIKSAFNP